MKYGVFGATGKMGKEVILASQNYTNAKLEKVLQKNFNESELLDLDFVIDFSSPEGSLSLLKKAGGKNVLIVCGTTGFTNFEFEELKELAKFCKILYSQNFSIGVFKLAKVLKILSTEFADYDAEILEKHHNLKKDSPSGTALLMGKTIADARGVDFDEVKNFNRKSQRKDGEIGFASIRQGAIFGFHEVSFAGKDERI